MRKKATGILITLALVTCVLGRASAQNLGAGKPKVYPVVDHGRLVGIVTRTAILAELARSGCGIELPKYATAED